jgi:hypothetical protein
MFNLCYILEMHSVRNLQALHAICVAPFLEMFFESPSTPVASASTNLALELNPQAMQLVEPVRDGLSIPAHRQILRVVLGPLVLIFLIRVQLVTDLLTPEII